MNVFEDFVPEDEVNDAVLASSLAALLLQNKCEESCCLQCVSAVQESLYADFKMKANSASSITSWC